MRRIIFLLTFLLLLPQLVEAKKILSIEINGPITTGTLELFKSGLEKAEELDAEALLVLIDTPGGGLTETLEIVKLIDRTEIPVISYVHPKGATAWSAGTIILVSSHVAAMSPNTVIGSAQPAALSSQGFAPINESKIINALTALVAEKARLHRRNETAAVAFIKENLNLNPEQAKQMKVIEFISPNIEDLLNQTNGAYLNSIKKTLNTKNAVVIKYKPSLRIQFLNLITNPMLASIFLILGIYALVFGFASPGFGSEIAGVVLISLGLLGLGFNINIIAIFLLLFGIILLLLEIKVPGFGALGIAGIIATIIGSILLVPTSFPRYFISKEFQKTMIATVVVPSIIFGIFLLFALYKVMKIRKKRPVIGEMIGDTAIVTEKITPKKTGYVEYKGETWQASSNKKIEKGEEVIIERKKGPVLIVNKKL
ncbi:nodulation protein NfeD [Candidatus Woesearchaeota archaeon]|nr:nodulation protein NfeD [Candidatus Woesearchaeota archaeon]